MRGVSTIPALSNSKCLRDIIKERRRALEIMYIRTVVCVQSKESVASMQRISQQDSRNLLDGDLEVSDSLEASS